MLPRPSTTLSFSFKEISAFTEKIVDLIEEKNRKDDNNNDINTNTIPNSFTEDCESSRRFCDILSTPTRIDPANTSNSPSVRTPLQSKK